MYWEPLIDLEILRKIQTSKLSAGHAAKVWNMEKFLTSVPEGMVRTMKACCVMWHDPILPMGGIGCDPGLRLGLAYLEAEDVAFTLSLYINRTNFSVRDVLTCLHSVPMLFPRKIQRKVPVIVEGAAYNAKYGQPLLGEIRAALILGFANEKYDLVHEIQPKSIRKRVFGNGDIQPKDFWPDLVSDGNKDSADALSMAICAGM